MIKELSGNNEFIDFEARIYSSSLGRFLSTDPLAGQYVWQSPYAYYLNSPIATIDYLGMGEEPNFFQKVKNFVKGEGYINQAYRHAEKNGIPSDWVNIENNYAVVSTGNAYVNKYGIAAWEEIRFEQGLIGMGVSVYVNFVSGGIDFAVDFTLNTFELITLDKQAWTDLYNKNKFYANLLNGNVEGVLGAASVIQGAETYISNVPNMTADEIAHDAGYFSAAVTATIATRRGGFKPKLRPAGVATKTSSNVLLNTSRQLQAKFKHAGDFGVVGNYSKANAAKFSSALNQHINAPGTQIIQGAYRNANNPVTFYLNPQTGLNVIASPSGQFISGAALSPAQVQGILTKGFLW